MLRGGTHRGVPATGGGGFVVIRQLQVVAITLSSSVPVGQFDAGSFVQNFALLLKIDASRIKVVSVQSRAQVAAQGGRRLADDGSSITVYISEPAPPMPESAFPDGNETLEEWNESSVPSPTPSGEAGEDDDSVDSEIIFSEIHTQTSTLTIPFVKQTSRRQKCCFHKRDGNWIGLNVDF